MNVTFKIDVDRFKKDKQVYFKQIAAFILLNKANRPDKIILELVKDAKLQ